MGRESVIGLAIAVMAAGCGSTSGQDSAPGTGGGDSGVPPSTDGGLECSKLGRVECAEHPECLRIEGWRLDTSTGCFEYRRFAYCDEARPCGDPMEYARDPEGNLWEFPSTCTPPGWPIEPRDDPYETPGGYYGCGDRGLHPDEPTADCEKFGSEVCEANEDCMAIWGMRPNYAEGCYEAWEFMSCEVSRNQACDDGPHCGRSPSGDWMIFGDGCIPDG